MFDWYGLHCHGRCRDRKQVIVGAGSLVPPGKVLESGFLYVGRPAIQVRALREDEIAFLKYSAEHYVRVKENHMSPRP